MREGRLRRVVLALALALSIVALVQSDHRARQGRCALLKWGPHSEALFAGEEIYQVGVEGYPTLPLSLLAMAPFHALGPRLGPLLWAALKIGLAWWIVSCALSLAAGSASAFPALGQLAVLLLSFRPLLSDVLHGNLNILVGVCVAASAWEWSRGRSFQSGIWIGVGAVLKVTPALGLLLFAWKRSGRGLAGALTGILAGAWLLPGLVLGWERNLALVGAWWQQMIAPYLVGRPLTLLQTEQINQSLLGVLGRLLTDSVAIAPRPGLFSEEVRVHWLALGPTAFRAVHRLACALVLAWLLACSSPAREPRRGLATLGEFSLLALSMLFLSERSWKHHYVLLAFPVAFLVWHASAARPRSLVRRVALAALVAAAALQSASGTAVLGARGSDLAEAYGAFLVAGVLLFAACGLCLRSTEVPPASDGDRTRSAGPDERTNEQSVVAQ